MRVAQHFNAGADDARPWLRVEIPEGDGSIRSVRAEGTAFCLAQPAGLGNDAYTRSSRANGPARYVCSEMIGPRKRPGRWP